MDRGRPDDLLPVRDESTPGAVARAAWYAWPRRRTIAAGASRSRRASRTHAPCRVRRRAQPRPWRARSGADARGPRDHRGPRPAAPGLDGRHQSHRDPGAGARRAQPRGRQPHGPCPDRRASPRARPRSGVRRRLRASRWRRRSATTDAAPGCLLEPVGKKALPPTVVDASGSTGASTSTLDEPRTSPATNRPNAGKS